MSKEFHIFKQNTEAIAPNRGFYYQYLKTVKLWLDNYVAKENNEIYCEREDDIFEYNPLSQTYKFRQIKCYSTASGLNSLEVKSSLLNFYMLYLKYGYQGLFYFESNTTIQPRAGKTLTEWIENQERGDFSVTNYLDEMGEIFRVYIQEKLDIYLEGKSKEEQDKAKQKADKFFQELNEPSFETFLESIRWSFSKELDTHKAIANLSENILKIISDKLQYDNRVDKELFLGYLVNMVLEKSIEADEEKRLLTNSLLQEALTKTEIDDTLFRSEIKELLKANFFIPHALTNTFKREELFIGREREFEDMKEFLTNENSLLLIHSIGGMGKTTLVKNFLYREQHNYVHYGYLFAGEDIKQSWVNSGFRKSLSLVMEKTDEAFTESMIALQALEGKTLLVIDNVENIENQEDAIEKIMGLAQNPNFDIVMTSREIIEGVSNPYELKSLSMEDAKTLFTSIYEVEDEVLLEEILGYLDCHTFFVEKVAQTLENKKGLLTLEDIKDKFDKNEFPDIRLKKRKSFNELLTKLFNLDKLEEDEVLLLKQLSVLPSIDIEFDFLSQIFQIDDRIEFQEELDYLNEKGWLIYAEGSYKLHQIIKEFILANYAPTLKESQNIIIFLNTLLFQLTIDKAINNKKYLIFFNNLEHFLEQKNYEDEEIALFLLRLSNLYIIFDMLDNVNVLLNKVLNMSSQFINKINNVELQTIYHLFARFYQKQGDVENSLKFFKKDLKLTKKILGGIYHSDVAVSYHDIGILYKNMGKYEEAFNNVGKSLEIRKKIFGKEHTETAISYSSLAEVYLCLEDDSFLIEALKLNKIALKIFIKQDNTSIHIASIYNELGRSYVLLGNLEEGLKNHKQALELRQDKWGEKNLQTAQSYNNLGEVYWYRKDYETALEFYKKDLNICQDILGENHIDMAISYNNIGTVYLFLGNTSKACRFLKKAIYLWEKFMKNDYKPLIIAKKNIEHCGKPK